MPNTKHWDTEELSNLLVGKEIYVKGGWVKDYINRSEADEIATEIVDAGFRKIFDGDCGLSSITDMEDREAAEAWMRFSNLVLGDHDGISAMKQMLHELGYRKVASE